MEIKCTLVFVRTTGLIKTFEVLKLYLLSLKWKYLGYFVVMDFYVYVEHVLNYLKYLIEILDVYKTIITMFLLILIEERFQSKMT